MQRQAATALAVALAVFGTAVFAQDGDLRSVTMRVVEDLAGIDAVVIELDSGPGAASEGDAAEVTPLQRDVEPPRPPPP